METKATRLSPFHWHAGKVMKAEEGMEHGSSSFSSTFLLEPHLHPGCALVCRLSPGTATVISPYRGVIQDWISKGMLVLNSHLVQSFLSIKKWELNPHLLAGQ